MNLGGGTGVDYCIRRMTSLLLILSLGVETKPRHDCLETMVAISVNAKNRWRSALSSLNPVPRGVSVSRHARSVAKEGALTYS